MDSIVLRPQTLIYGESMASETFCPAVGDALPSGRSAGVAIALASVLSVAFMAHHPTVHAHKPSEFVAEMTLQAAADRVVHGFLIALMGILLYGFTCLASRLGMNSFCVRAGLIAYVVGIIAVIPAALVDGFIIPDFASRYQSRPAEDLQTMQHILTLCGVAIRVCSRAWVVAVSTAVILWSTAFVHRSGLLRAVGIFGWIAGALPLIALFSGYLPMNVHGVLAFIFCQGTWNLAVARLLIRNRI
jgi:hypothetical protein